MNSAHVRGEPLRIAVVSPLYESVPPRLYGGTERVVSFLTEELVRMGHDVTLFASADSRTAARLDLVLVRELVDQLVGARQRILLACEALDEARAAAEELRELVDAQLPR